MDQSLNVDGVGVPRLLYGTAWKEVRTRSLTELAIRQGFRGIDTANQRRHYHEAAVGEAIAAAMSSGLVQRKELFLQTKFTFRPGQDNRLPYDPNAPIRTQVEQSLASSLNHLHTDVVDSYVLHGPTRSPGLGREDWQAWEAMERIYERGQARLLGVSNVTLEQLALLCDGARIRPRFVQNRCFAAFGWDRAVRAYCVANEIVYQGFSLLTANRGVLAHPRIVEIAEGYGRTVSQVVFGFARAVGMVALTGTTSAAHMREDLDAFDFELTAEDVAQIECLAEA